MFTKKEKNIFGAKGPRKFQIVTPLYNGSAYHDIRPVGKHDDLESLVQSRSKNVSSFVNNPPQWSEGQLTRARGLCTRLLQQSGKALGEKLPAG
jgi:hypothetical protein